MTEVAIIEDDVNYALGLEEYFKRYGAETGCVLKKRRYDNAKFPARRNIARVNVCKRICHLLKRREDKGGCLTAKLANSCKNY